MSFFAEMKLTFYSTSFNFSFCKLNSIQLDLDLSEALHNRSVVFSSFSLKVPL